MENKEVVFIEKLLSHNYCNDILMTVNGVINIFKDTNEEISKEIVLKSLEVIERHCKNFSENEKERATKVIRLMRGEKL